MAKIVNTLPHSRGRADLPLLERLRRVLERFMQNNAHAKNKKNKGILELLKILNQYSIAMLHMSLAVGRREPDFSIPLPTSGAEPHVFTPATDGVVNARFVKQEAHMPFIVGKARFFPQGVLQNTIPLSRREVLVASTVQIGAQTSVQFAQPRKYKIQNSANILAHRPFFVLPRMPLVRSSGVKEPVGAVAPAGMRISARAQKGQVRQIQHHTKALTRKYSLRNPIMQKRIFQGVLAQKQPHHLTLPMTPRIAARHTALPVAHNVAGAFLPSSSLMRAAVQPVVALAQPALAPQGQGALRPTSGPFVTPSPQPAPMPPRAAMQGLGGGDSATLAALSTLGSI